LIELTENVGRRLRRAGKLARTGTIKLRYADFRTLTRQQPLPQPTNTDLHLLDCALSLYDREQVRRPVRLIGFGVSNLLDPEAMPPTQQELFALEPNPPPPKMRGALDTAVDRIRARFGIGALRRGGTESGER
jgi:DNA polymerase-4